MFHAKVKASKFLPILKRLFDYKGRTVYLCEGETAHISDYWDEGCRAYPVLFNPITGMRLLNQWELLFKRQEENNPYHADIGTVTLEPGIGLAEHVYSGTRQYLRVTLHPTEDRTEWLS